MRTLSDIRLIHDDAASGLENMARDEALLHLVSAGELGPVLRFYQWSPATLSLGYFQRLEERHTHPTSLDCPIVRRASGGGAILHDQELTYALILPVDQPLAANLPGASFSERLYRLVHQALIDVLRRDWRIEAMFWEQLVTLATTTSAWTFSCGDQSTSSPGEPFLCFQRRTAGDLVLPLTANQLAIWPRTGPLGQPASIKILGSAQRRPRGAILQHGSLLLGKSSFAGELPGLGDWSDRQWNAGELATVWGDEICQRLGLTARAETLKELIASDHLDQARTKFHEVSWLEMR